MPRGKKPYTLEELGLKSIWDHPVAFITQASLERRPAVVEYQKKRLVRLEAAAELAREAAREEAERVVARRYDRMRRRRLKESATPPLPPAVRFAVLQRDGFTCQYCGRQAPLVILHVDHRVSRANGGSDEMSNLVAACSACNFGKGRLNA
jgi:5-methylcytosine-specific restriction endonuclease McrA